MNREYGTTAVAAGVVELAPFRTRPGVDDATVLAASDALQREFLDGRPGFIRRDLLRNSDGSWLDLLYWADERSAMSVMDDIASSNACQQYFALMEGADAADPGAGVSHFSIVRPYGPDR